MASPDPVPAVPVVNAATASSFVAVAMVNVVGRLANCVFAPSFSSTNSGPLRLITTLYPSPSSFIFDEEVGAEVVIMAL